MSSGFRDAAGGEAPEAVQPVGFGPGVHGAGGLVQDQQGRLAEESAGKGDALPFADAQLGSVFKPFSQQMIVAVGQTADGPGGAGGLSRGLDGGLQRCACQVAEGDVLAAVAL